MVDIFLEEGDGQWKRKRQVDLLVLEGSCDEVSLCKLLQTEPTASFRMFNKEGAHGKSKEKDDEQLLIHDCNCIKKISKGHNGRNVSLPCLSRRYKFQFPQKNHIKYCI